MPIRRGKITRPDFDAPSMYDKLKDAEKEMDPELMEQFLTEYFARPKVQMEPGKDEFDYPYSDKYQLVDPPQQSTLPPGFMGGAAPDIPGGGSQQDFSQYWAPPSVPDNGIPIPTPRPEYPEVPIPTPNPRRQEEMRDDLIKQLLQQLERERGEKEILRGRYSRGGEFDV